MAGPEGASGLGVFLGGVGQNIAANICGAAIGAACVTFGLSSNDQLEHPSNWPLWLAFTGAIVLIAGGWNASRLMLSSWRQRRSISKARSDRVGILLARFQGDTADNPMRETIREGIEHELGHAVDVIAWPEVISLPEGASFDAGEAAGRAAQRAMREKNCEVAIWGRVKSTDLVVLRLTAAEGNSGAATTHRLTETMELPAGALQQLGGAIAARAVSLAAPAISSAGWYLVPQMRAVAERLERLCAMPPASFDADAKGQLFFSYALALHTLGEQTGNAEYLEKAVGAYRAALKEDTRERKPLQWARTHNNLGNVLCILGERSNNKEQLKGSIEAFRSALVEFTREHTPLDWAMAQTNLGVALSILGERENRIAFLDEAVEAYRAALLEFTRERVPLQWATTQNQLGIVLCVLGESQDNTVRLEEAIEAFNAALQEATRGRVPLQWAATQHNLGNALLSLGQHRGSLSLLRQAVEANRAALEERTRERVPQDWAATQHNLGIALATLGVQESDVGRLREAIEAFCESLEERIRERVPFLCAQTRHDMAIAFLVLFEKTAEPHFANDALAAVDDALEVFRDAKAEYHIRKAETLRADILAARGEGH